MIKEEPNNQDKIKIKILQKTLNPKKINNKINQRAEEMNNKIKVRIQEFNEKIKKYENNSNLIKYYDNNIDEDGKLSFTMESCDNNLREYLDKNCHKKGQGLDIRQIYDILAQLNNAFRILEIEKINHGNIKLENILIKLDENRSIFKLSGFDFIPELINTSEAYKIDKIYMYLPPELLQENNINTFEIDEKTDSWSLGVIIYYLYFKEFPYNGENCKTILEQINNNNIRRTNFDELDNLIDGLLNKNKEQRFTLDEYLSHPFFTFRRDYELLGSLGGESCYEIYKVKEKKTNLEKVIKIIHKEKIRTEYKKKYMENITENEMEEFIKLLVEQTEIMKKLEDNNENKNTVQFFEYINSNKEFSIVMEKCDTDLGHTFTEKENNFSLKEIKEILIQLNNTFRIMSVNKIIHGDLKLENILIKTENNKSIYKLTDYGVSKKFLDMNKKLMSWGGAPQYTAPEILLGNNFNSSCDLWSLGIILYNLYFRNKPYDGNSSEEVSVDIKTKGQYYLNQLSDDPQFDHLIRRLLTVNQKDRITWEEYFVHPFFEGGTCWKYYEEKKSIGMGQYYEVYKVKSKRTGEFKAIKAINLKRIKTLFQSKYNIPFTKEHLKDYISDFIEEFKSSELRRGPKKENINTIIYEQYFQTDDEFCIVEELCDGDLLQLKEKKGRFKAKEIYQIFNQLNNTFKIIQKYKQNVRDLRIEEILYCKNKEGKEYIYKISNSKNDKKIIQLLNANGSIADNKYKAPEILEILSNPEKRTQEELNSLYQKAYLWNLGIIIFILYFGKFPYKGDNPKEILGNINKDEKTKLNEIDDNDLKDLLKKLLTDDKDERIDWNDYFNHRFFSEEKWKQK